MADYIPLLNPLAYPYPEGKHVGITGIKSVPVTDNYVIAESAVIKPYGYYLSVGGSYNGISLAEVGNIYTPVYIVLPRKGVNVLAKAHGNPPHPALYGPDAGDFR